MTDAFLSDARQAFHSALLQNNILSTSEKSIPSNADASSRVSVAIANGILEKLGKPRATEKLRGQIAGATFERVCAEFIDVGFRALGHMRPGHWVVGKGGNVAHYDQYSHLAALEVLAKQNRELWAALGSDYLIKPDIVIARHPEPDESFDTDGSRAYLNDHVAKLTPLRLSNNDKPILHASISCKWTIRSDRVQNARSEGLVLVRNRKGRLPHIAVITGEPSPSRIASIALGTGDIDCVYHFALTELREVVSEPNLGEASDLVETMIAGKRLRDISDLPVDLVI